MIHDAYERKTAKQKPLTRTQELDLRKLAKPDSYQSGYGCTNRTMRVLEGRTLRRSPYLTKSDRTGGKS